MSSSRLSALATDLPVVLRPVFRFRRLPAFSASLTSSAWAMNGIELGLLLEKPNRYCLVLDDHDEKGKGQQCPVPLTSEKSVSYTSSHRLSDKCGSAKRALDGFRQSSRTSSLWRKKLFMLVRFTRLRRKPPPSGGGGMRVLRRVPRSEPYVFVGCHRRKPVELHFSVFQTRLFLAFSSNELPLLYA